MKPVDAHTKNNPANECFDDSDRQDGGTDFAREGHFGQFAGFLCTAGRGVDVTSLCQKIDTRLQVTTKIRKSKMLWLACGAGLIDVSLCQNLASKRAKVCFV